MNTNVTFNLKFIDLIGRLGVIDSNINQVYYIADRMMIKVLNIKSRSYYPIKGGIVFTISNSEL